MRTLPASVKKSNSHEVVYTQHEPPPEVSSGRTARQAKRAWIRLAKMIPGAYFVPAARTWCVSAEDWAAYVATLRRGRAGVLPPAAVERPAKWTPEFALASVARATRRTA